MKFNFLKLQLFLWLFFSFTVLGSSFIVFSTKNYQIKEVLR